MASFSMLFCFLVLVLRSIYCVNITVHPASINTTLNSTVTFTCEAIAKELSFRVNDTPANHEEVVNKGFTVTIRGTGTLEGELEAIAYGFNNNTNIACKASTDNPPAILFSNTALLLIQGLLASVGNLNFTYINGSDVRLSWTAPYTLDNVPITGYCINDANESTTELSYILSPPNLINLDPACDITKVTVSAVNDAGIGQPASTSFYYKKAPGPVTNIGSSIDNCSNISITWDSPKLDDCRVSTEHYLLTIYDDITGIIVKNVPAYDTSYHFEDEDLFIHRYTYVITGANELGKGISNNKTFSYQRIPRSATESTFEILNYTQNSATVEFNIPVTVECTGEAPENATITIECNGTEIFNDTYLVEYARQPMNVTDSVLVPQNQECILSIVFSNQVGSSEPFTLTLNTTYTPPSTTSPSPSSTSSPLPPVIIGVVSGGSICVLLAIIIIIVACCCWISRRNKRSHDMPSDTTTTPANSFSLNDHTSDTD